MASCVVAYSIKIVTSNNICKLFLTGFWKNISNYFAKCNYRFCGNNTCGINLAETIVLSKCALNKIHPP